MKKPKDRDGNVLKSYKREICLQTKVVQDKSKYSRDKKHKSEAVDEYLDVFDIDVEDYLKS